MTLKRFLVGEGLSLAFIVVFVSLLRTTVFGLYHLPSEAMKPTLLPGDTVLVNRLAYGLHLPFGRGPAVHWALPARGDVVVFRDPSGEGVLVKRVVGLGGDRIVVKAGRITLNGRPLEDVELTDESLYARHEVPVGQARMAWESPHGAAAHLVQHALGPERSTLDSREFVVPPGRLFCMGDNREDTPENRFWGFLERDHILGRAERVAYSIPTARPPANPGLRWWRTLSSIP